jgi:hypothetical protein
VPAVPLLLPDLPTVARVADEVANTGSVESGGATSAFLFAVVWVVGLVGRDRSVGGLGLFGSELIGV